MKKLTKGCFEDELTFENLFLVAVLEFVLLENSYDNNLLTILLSPLFVSTKVEPHGSGS